MSGVIQTPLWLDNFPAVDNNPNLLGFTVAIYDIGCLLGVLWCMLLGDKQGRKKSCILGGLFVVVGVVIQVTAFKKREPQMVPSVSSLSVASSLARATV